MELNLRQQELSVSSTAAGVSLEFSPDAGNSADIQMMIDREAAATKHLLDEIDRSVTSEMYATSRLRASNRKIDPAGDDSCNGDYDNCYAMDDVINDSCRGGEVDKRYRTETELMLSPPCERAALNNSCSSLSESSSEPSSPCCLSSSGGVVEFGSTRSSFEDGGHSARYGDYANVRGDEMRKVASEIWQQQVEIMKQLEREQQDKQQLKEKRMQELMVEKEQLEKLQFQVRQSTLSPNQRTTQQVIPQEPKLLPQVHHPQQASLHRAQTELQRLNKQQQIQKLWQHQHQTQSEPPCEPTRGQPLTMTSAEFAAWMFSFLPSDSSTSTDKESDVSSAEDGEFAEQNDIKRISSGRLVAIRQQMTASVRRMKELEEQNKAIAVLQV